MILGKEAAGKVMTIECRNLDKKTLTLETDFVRNDFLELALPVGLTLLPYNNIQANVMKIPITFRPRKEGKFSSAINFFINGRHKVEVLAKGEAISCLYELANP